MPEYRDYKGVDGQVDKADPPSKSKKSTRSKPAKTGGTTYDQAKGSEHKGSQGERAFGTPMDRQTTDSNN
jgi:hypothetical protein